MERGAGVSKDQLNWHSSFKYKAVALSALNDGSRREPDVVRGVKRYGDLLSECRARYHHVRETLNAFPAAGSATWDDVYRLESVFLQVRLLSEALALAVLICHISDEAPITVQKAYQADKIFNVLQSVNRRSFPSAYEIDDNGKLTTTEDGISLDQFNYTYRLCGGVLHRGKLDSVATGGVRSLPLSDVRGWADRIESILSNNIVFLGDREHFIGLQTTEKGAFTIFGQPKADQSLIDIDLVIALLAAE